MKTYKVKYIGEDMAEIRKGDICDAHELKSKMSPKGMGAVFAVVDRSGESYIYPKNLFEVVDDGEDEDK